MQLTVQVASPNSVKATPSVQPSVAASSNVYDFGPSGTTFAQPVSLGIKATQAAPARLKNVLAYLDTNNVWQVLLDSQVSADETVTATTTHFTQFAVVSVPLNGAGCVSQRDPNVYCGSTICDLNGNVCAPIAALTLRKVNATAAVGQPVAFAVYAVGSDGNAMGGYGGTVHFTSNDFNATLPVDYTFNLNVDSGFHTFTVTFGTVGTDFLSVTDTQQAVLTNTVAFDVVSTSAVADQLVVEAPLAVTVGNTFTSMVSATEDGNVVTGFTDTVLLSSADPSALIPSKLN